MYERTELFDEREMTADALADTDRTWAPEYMTEPERWGLEDFADLLPAHPG